LVWALSRTYRQATVINVITTKTAVSTAVAMFATSTDRRLGSCLCGRGSGCP